MDGDSGVYRPAALSGFFFICIVVNCDYYFNNVLVDNRE